MTEPERKRRLDISLPSDREIRITRTFDAPRSLVFDAFTKPEILKKWMFGPDGWELAVCEYDLRPGGSIRYIWRNAAGTEMGMSGTCVEADPPARLVARAKFDEAWYPGEEIETIVFTEHDGRTTITNTITYDTKEARDTVLKSPMATGMADGFDRLEKFFAAEVRAV